MFKVNLSNFGNATRLFSAQNVVQYILDELVLNNNHSLSYIMQKDSCIFFDNLAHFDSVASDLELWYQDIFFPSQFTNSPE